MPMMRPCRICRARYFAATTTAPSAQPEGPVLVVDRDRRGVCGSLRTISWSLGFAAAAEPIRRCDSPTRKPATLTERRIAALGRQRKPSFGHRWHASVRQYDVFRVGLLPEVPLPPFEDVARRDHLANQASD